MALKKYTLPDGSEIAVDDTVSLLGPNPNLVGTTAADSPRDRRYQHIPAFHAPQSPAPKVNSGYGSGVDDDEWNKRFWPGNERV